MENSKNINQAEFVALKALLFLTSNFETAKDFFSLTGISPDNIRESAQIDGFLPSIIGYLMQNEQLLLNFCQSENIDPRDISLYYQQLSTTS